jgi:hypothetical protein
MQGNLSMTFLKSRVRLTALVAVLVAVGSLTTAVYRAVACPFCSAVSLTFGEEINNSQVAVIAKLTAAPPPATDANSLDVAKAKFEIIKVLKGEDVLGKERKLEAVYFGDSAVGSTFLILGIDPPNINWSTPIALSERGVEYVTRGMELPKEGADRLFFFQDYLEDKDETLARDAYDEFAKAPYPDVLGLAPRMQHDKLIGWVKSTEIPVSRRRLYLTMLGAARNPDDVPVFEEMIKSKDRQTKGALDALVAAYLTLKGPDGMPLVEDLFLKNQDAEYTDTYATIMALRFHGTEEKIIPRERLLVGLRMMLDRPQLADLVIPDLARWEDWSVVDRLVELFKKSDEESSWVRVPVINYLRACPLPDAKVKIDELAKIDPESIKRANSFFPLGTTAGADAAKDKPTDGTNPAESEKAEADSEAKPAAGAAKGDASPTEKKTSAKAKTADQPTASATIRLRPATEVSQAKPTAVLPGQLAPGAAMVPGPPAQSMPVVAGMAAAAFVLACAFWAILKGGQRAAG